MTDLSVFIVGTGSSVPERVVTNKELGARLNVDDEWILAKTGIAERRWVSGEASCRSLAVSASREALRVAGVKPEEVDWLIAGTMTPEMAIPGIGPFVQEELSLGKCPCIDIRSSCCTALHGMELASALIKSGRANHILLVGAEGQSRALPMTNGHESLSILFGDGAGAWVVSNRKVSGPALEISNIILGTDGRQANSLGVSVEYGSPESMSVLRPVMNGHIVMMHSVRRMSEAVLEAMGKEGLSSDDIDLVVPHQANANIIRLVCQQIGILENKAVSILKDRGNTSSASLFMALDHARKQEMLKSGQNVVMVGFGAGFSWGACAARVV